MAALDTWSQSAETHLISQEEGAIVDNCCEEENSFLRKSIFPVVFDTLSYMMQIVRHHNESGMFEDAIQRHVLIFCNNASLTCGCTIAELGLLALLSSYIGQLRAEGRAYEILPHVVQVRDCSLLFGRPERYHAQYTQNPDD